jgi:hypothetical protein
MIMSIRRPKTSRTVERQKKLDETERVTATPNAPGRGAAEADLERVRDHVKEKGLSPEDVSDAVRWARSRT